MSKSSYRTNLLMSLSGRAGQSRRGLEDPVMWRTHWNTLAPGIQTERLDWNLQDLCDRDLVLLP